MSHPVRRAKSPAICIRPRGSLGAVMQSYAVVSLLMPSAIVMPAFGAYTGGLSILDLAFARVFAARAFTAHLLGGRRLYAFPAAHCAG